MDHKHEAHPHPDVATIHSHAIAYRKKGFFPIPVSGKRPRPPGWQDLRLSEEQIPIAFQPGDNIGLVLGTASGGIVDVDLDAPEARALAPDLLPPTGWRHGRESSPASHYWYRAPGAGYLKLADPVTGTCLLELRQDGHQTVVPPSVHPCGERYEWDASGEMGEVGAKALERTVKLIGAATLLARYWPVKGSRDTAALALSGLLTRSGWSEAEVDSFITSAARVAGDEEYLERAKAARSAARLREGRPTFGWPKLAEIVGERVATKISEWLGLAPAPAVVTPLRDFDSEHGRLDAFIEDEAHLDGQRVLVYWRGDYYAWARTHWRRLEAERREEELEARIVAWLRRTGQEKKISARTLDSLLRLLPSSAIRVPEALEDGAWIGSGDPPAPPRELIPLDNGQFHAPTRTCLPHSPGWFNLSARPFSWSPEADCPRFRAALGQWFADDPASAQVLQEIVGYVVAGRTDQEKAFYFQGPPRSGKSTMADLIEALVGPEHVASPSLNHLGKEFGQEDWIGKRAIIFRDARLAGRGESAAATEQLLRVTGRDSLTIQRKYRSAWKGTINAPIVVISNVVAKFPDASAAIASRFVHVGFRHSFLGKEDPSLKRDVLAELPGIFRWALEGLARLNARGYFLQPASGEDARDSMTRSSSPIGAFIEDAIAFEEAAVSSVDDLFYAYRAWCAESGSDPGAKGAFLEDLLSFCLAHGHPEVRRARPGARSENRSRVVTGIRMRAASGGQVRRLAA